MISALPSDWYAYTNLDLATAVGASREIDVIMVVEDRILVIDLKNWRGPIESRDGNWFNAGRDHGPSPVRKISENAREVFIQLQAHLKRHSKGRPIIPRVQGLVVLTGATDLSGLAETEAKAVMSISQFTSVLKSRQRRIETFGKAPPHGPLTTKEWKDQLSKFFNVRKGVFVPGRRSFGEFYAESPQPVFQHPAGIYSEFNASDERKSPQLGVLRLWDFTKADPRFQTAEGRSEIAGREQEVISYLQDRSDHCDSVLVETRTRDPDFGPAYWEVFERRRRLHRLVEFASTELSDLTREERLELARQLLASLDALHVVEAAHLDIGQHSIWVQRPSTVRLSHLMAASYPDVKTLGRDRYQFLSTGRLPEDVFGEDGSAKQRDVYLTACAVHRIVFGRGPALADGCAEWDPEIDGASDYLDLLDWFERALAWDPAQRFKDAGEALVAFNSATAKRPSAAEVIQGLERHQEVIKSQMQLFTAFPPVDSPRETQEKIFWRARHEDRDVLVKVWKSAAWGDQKREGSRILDFLDRLSEMAISRPKGCAKIIDAFWLGDAVAVIQEWVDRENLAQLIARNALPDLELRYALLAALADRVQELHEQHLAHGDLKPEHVLVDPATPDDPLIVDVVDFAAVSDGEPQSSRYSPELGDSFQRDCFAITVIAEMLLEEAVDPRAQNVRSAVSTIRQAEPANATLLPLIDALALVFSEDAADTSETLTLLSPHATPGPLLADEGKYFLRQFIDRRALAIRGATEEIVVYASAAGQPSHFVRQPIDQSRIARVSRHEFGELECSMLIEQASASDLSALEPIFARDDVKEVLPIGKRPSQVGDAETQDVDGEVGLDDDDAPSESARDDLVEEIAAEPDPSGDVSVARLWTSLVDAERELVTYGRATDDSVFDRHLSKHRVQFDLASGSLDYSRRDRVMVERINRHDQWRPIAILDLANSRPNALALESDSPFRGSRPLVEAGDQLRFRSRMEETSFDRRQSAVARVVGRNSRVKELIDVVDRRSDYSPMISPERIPPEELQALYGLNPLQAQTLSQVLATRPLSLVQGPPGTGKTVFIAALVHAALSRGLARNVLLSSQAHEAVNNAAEAVLKLFGRAGEVPSILRVGVEGVVSDPLLPFHVDRVEQLYKDRFRAEMRERLASACSGLGIDENLGAKLSFIELAIRPVATRLAEIEDLEDQPDRIHALKETIRKQAEFLDLPGDLNIQSPAEQIIERIVTGLLASVPHDERPSPDRIARFQSVASLARDFVATVSTERRSFETFLAGTRQIVAGTCVGLGRSSLGLTSTAFDLVIVDEAARCTASELAVPLQAGSNIVLVGDQKQLEPMHPEGVIKDVADKLGINKAEVLRSDFERVFEGTYGRRAGHTLKTQYRMLEPIGEIVSQAFYKGELTHGRKTPLIEQAALPSELTAVVNWIDTEPLGDQAIQSGRDRKKSISNPVEADAIVALLRRWSQDEGFIAWLEDRSNQGPAIGIICAYSAQLDLVRRKLSLAPIHSTLRDALKIGTLDSYQGKENPIVILSLVRNNREGPQQDGRATIRPGFLATANRINVAISRAMDRLVIVGSRSRWQEGSPMDKVSKAFLKALAQGQGELIDASDLINDPEFRVSTEATRPAKREVVNEQ
nr:AAA domain-containing protein [Qipengyuania aestuarii]